MMVALLLYAYAVGVPSSRKIERRTHEDIAFRVIAGGTHPDHTRISEFRRIHLKELEKLFVQVLQLCAKAKLVKLGHIAIDGTKIKANASKHKAMSYKRMKAEEAKLADKVRALLEAAEAADSQEDAAYGRGVRGDELPRHSKKARSRSSRQWIIALQSAWVSMRPGEPRVSRHSSRFGKASVSGSASTPRRSPEASLF